MTYESYSGSVLEQRAGRAFSPYDTIRSHFINYLRDNLSDIYLSDTSSGTTVKVIGDFYNRDNLVLPSCVVSVIGEITISYHGNMLFIPDLSSGSSGSTYYGETVEYDIRFDVWTRNSWERDVIAGEVRNLLGWGMSPASNTLYNVGIRNVKFIGSDILGYDQTDRIIREVSHIDASDLVFRRSILTAVTADVYFRPPVGEEDYMYSADEIILQTYIASGASGSYDILVSSGSIQE